MLHISGWLPPFLGPSFPAAAAAPPPYPGQVPPLPSLPHLTHRHMSLDPPPPASSPTPPSASSSSSSTSSMWRQHPSPYTHDSFSDNSLGKSDSCFFCSKSRFNHLQPEGDGGYPPVSVPNSGAHSKRHSTPATLVWLDTHYHLLEGVSKYIISNDFVRRKI